MAIPIALLEYVFILYLEVNSLKTFPEMKKDKANSAISQ
jgi:uncharacterized membrane protein